MIIIINTIMIFSSLSATKLLTQVWSEFSVIFMKMMDIVSLATNHCSPELKGKTSTQEKTEISQINL